MSAAKPPVAAASSRPNVPSLGLTVLLTATLANPGCQGEASSKGDDDGASGGDAKIAAPWVGMRRLTREEYANTVRDLVGVELDVRGRLPVDPITAGFDNNADVLGISSLELDEYDRFAEQIAAAVMKPDSEAHARFVDCALQADDCAGKILQALADRAFRRPSRDEERDALLAVMNDAEAQGDSRADAFALALRALFVSPQFLFRVEADPESGKERALDGYELASRLSYLLWGSLPDDELFDDAATGRLEDPKHLRATVARLLRDGKAARFTDRFAVQWLALGKLAEHTVDPQVLPEFDPALLGAMDLETRTFFDEMVQSERPLSAFLVADHTFLDERLARHYGIDGVQGDELRRVDGARALRRGGLLGQGAILTLTSFPERTSVVKRGEWVLSHLLCEAPPPAPGGVPPLEEAPLKTGTLRQRLESHRQKPECISCHQLMDPIGFGLENYDAVGLWRTQDEGAPIDATGELPDGRRFDGPDELTALLADDARVASCFGKSLYTFALGTRPDDDIEAWLTGQAAQSGNQATVDDVLTRLITSTPFRRRGAPPAQN